jgi:hypothetical protein
MRVPVEPTRKTKQEIGSLCQAWAYLEVLTERAIWGMLKLDNTHGPLVIWRMDMKMRWEMLLNKAPQHLPDEMEFLRKMSKDVTTCTRDRNIIVHGLIHARVALPETTAFWSVFRGADAGKKFRVSTHAAQTTRENIQLLGKRMEEFNNRHLYWSLTHGGDGVEQQNWPKRIQ